MKYKEILSWILDKEGIIINSEKEYKENIDFVHSLGLKCDSVGWCKIDLSDPRTEDILNEISLFCRENGWKARGLYTRTYIDAESDWFELVLSETRDNTVCGGIKTVTDEGEDIKTLVVRAYHELTPSPKKWGEVILVPERFRNFCMENYPGVFDFCWAKDIGKYDSEQYFHIYGKKMISHICVDYELNKQNSQLITDAGGWLPKLAETFHVIQKVYFDDCYLASDLPEGGIVSGYIPETFSRLGRNTILIHKDVAENLLRERIVPSGALRPAAVSDVVPGGYSLYDTEVQKRPCRQFMDTMLSGYEELRKTFRPVRAVTEKDALKILRTAKKERQEDFRKALPKLKVQEAENTEYSVLMPYYRISDGGYLSDEYEFLSYNSALNENYGFVENLSTEELMDSKLSGIVFGKCPDGDYILLCDDGKVVRFSHEMPEIVEEWPCAAQFFVDVINE